MKRLLMSAVIAAVAVGIVAINTVKADSKVTICHFPDDKGVGRVIEVAPSSVPAHVANHGDYETDLPVREACDVLQYIGDERKSQGAKYVSFFDLRQERWRCRGAVSPRTVPFYPSSVGAPSFAPCRRAKWMGRACVIPSIPLDRSATGSAFPHLSSQRPPTAR